MFKIPVKIRASLLRDVVFSANDGAITTFAIVAGSQGASLSNSVILILGVANLLADGLSMASGNYLGVKTEVAYKKARDDSENDEGSPFVHGIFTFIAFALAGCVPLLPYIFNLPGAFGLSTAMVVATLFSVGYLRGRAMLADGIRSGFEMLVVGGSAAVVAYSVGFILENYVV